MMNEQNIIQIVEREVAFGMLPVLPAFAGYVPDELIVDMFIVLIINQQLYPNVSYSISPSWTNFEAPYGHVCSFFLLIDWNI